MNELWIAIGIVSLAFVFSFLALFFHKRIGAGSSPDALKNTVEIMKLFGLFVVAAVSFYFLDFQKQREEREKFEFEVFKAFAEQGMSGTAERKLGVSKAMREYRKEYAKANPRLSKLLNALDTIILEDREVRALLSLQENAPILNAIATDQDPAIAKTGQEIRASPYQALIEQLFSAESRLRVRAYDEIKNRFGKESAIIDDLIQYARANMDNENGVYNTVVTLKDLSREVTQPKKDEINSFCEEAQLIGDKTRKQCSVLRTWLETSRR